jgi:acetylornithine deacetylase/succinyl-diaminopimelate desuccinylase-like protein
LILIYYFKTKKLKELGAENIELADLGEQKLPDGSSIPLPPLVFGNLGSDPKKKTVLIYGHLDVQPANLVNETYFNFFNSSFSSI